MTQLKLSRRNTSNYYRTEQASGANVLHNLLIVSIIFACFFFGGCSCVLKDYYFSPTSKFGTLKRKPDVHFAPFFWGPADHIILSMDGVSVDISSEAFDHTAISGGPVICPVIPAFLYIWSVYVPEEPNQLKIQIQFLSGKGTIKTVADKFFLITDNGNKLVPYETNFLRNVLSLTYDINPSDLRSFELSLNGIVGTNKTLSFPSVKFKEASGWVIVVGP